MWAKYSPENITRSWRKNQIGTKIRVPRNPFFIFAIYLNREGGFFHLTEVGEDTIINIGK